MKLPWQGLTIDHQVGMNLYHPQFQLADKESLLCWSSQVTLKTSFMPDFSCKGLDEFEGLQVSIFVAQT